jgi:NADH:ubiquinone oxidoreductase subunit C
MTQPVLGRADDALDPAETTAFLQRRLGDDLLSTTDEFGTYTVTVTPQAWVQAATICRDEDLLAYDMFDSLFGVDAGEDGFDVVAILYSTSRGRRILLRARAEGGRDNPTMPSIVDLFPGADWMERETWDMFGIEFDGHPGLAPRILTVENFEGWPLRKDFQLASRAAKPWPGVKEPAETDEDGNVIVKVPGPGEAPGPSGLDEIMAAQSKAANPRPESEVEAADSGDAGDDEPAREEVEIDQETYDRLIAEGKSERIARSKAKAAYVKKQRQAAAGQDDAPAADGAGTDEPSAADKAEQVRQEQAQARAEKAAEQAAATDDQDDDVPVVAEGTPPADEPPADEPQADQPTDGEASDGEVADGDESGEERP